ncbi:MAG TPA: hypothetical protein VKQ08_12625, partial [Cyclobacteriaceae bacterium]|nr:hypothetical protein [Cyclobacteriaceae bacterium]
TVGFLSGRIIYMRERVCLRTGCSNICWWGDIRVNGNRFRWFHRLPVRKPERQRDQYCNDTDEAND